MLIKVTADDLLKGKMGSSKHCALAIALQRNLNDEYIRVGIYPHTSLSGSPTYVISSFAFNNNTRVDLNSEVSSILRNIDNKKQVDPFEFELAETDVFALTAVHSG